MDAVLHQDTQPTTFDEWVTMAKTELQKYTRRQAFKNPEYAKFQWIRPKHNGHDHYRHPNDQTVPMDIDPPVFTQVRRAYTEADKDRFKKEGRCFYCDNQGHISKYCPKKKSQNAPQNPQYRPKPQWQNSKMRKKPSDQQTRSQGFRKRNQSYQQRSSQIRTAKIEEIEEEQPSSDEEPRSLAARTARLSEDQREQWVQEMKAMGINF